MLDVDSAQKAPNEPLTPLDFGVDPVLLAATVRGTRMGLSMTQANIVPVGTSRLTTARHAVTIMVGLVGVHSGNIALNFSEAAAKHLAAGLLHTIVDEMNEICIDAVMELGNMVAGGIKRELVSSEFAIENISLPSLVLGQSYSMAYSRGIRTVSVEFELPDMPFSPLNGRFFSSTLSLLSGTGS